jgi:hypothetical protein
VVDARPKLSMTELAAPLALKAEEVSALPVALGARFAVALVLPARKERAVALLVVSPLSDAFVDSVAILFGVGAELPRSQRPAELPGPAHLWRTALTLSESDAPFLVFQAPSRCLSLPFLSSSPKLAGSCEARPSL